MFINMVNLKTSITEKKVLVRLAFVLETLIMDIMEID